MAFPARKGGSGPLCAAEVLGESPGPAGEPSSTQRTRQRGEHPPGEGTLRGRGGVLLPPGRELGPAGFAAVCNDQARCLGSRRPRPPWSWPTAASAPDASMPCGCVDGDPVVGRAAQGPPTAGSNGRPCESRSTSPDSTWPGARAPAAPGRWDVGPILTRPVPCEAEAARSTRWGPFPGFRFGFILRFPKARRRRQPAGRFHASCEP